MNAFKNNRMIVVFGMLLAAAFAATGCGVNSVDPMTGSDSNVEVDLPAGYAVGSTVTVNGVQVFGNPEQEGADAPRELDDDNARTIIEDAGKTSADLGKVQVTRMRTSKNPADVNDTITFTGTVTGGTGRYYLFWWLEGDKAWTKGTGGWTFTRKVTMAPEQLLYFAAVDTAGTKSGTTTWKVKVNRPAPTPSPCNAISGT